MRRCGEKLDSSFVNDLAKFQRLQCLDLCLFERNFVPEKTRLGAFVTRLSGDFVHDVAILSSLKGPYER